MRGHRGAATLSPAKRELLSLLLKKEGIEAGPSPGIARGDAHEHHQLSFAQERIWVFEQLEPGTATYNVPSAARLTGRLNLPALEQGFGEIVRRHESLRTTFRAVEGRPLQVVEPCGPPALPFVDLSGLSEAGRERVARRLADEEARLPFDLTRDALLRCRILRLGEAEHVMLLSIHHIASDGWSTKVLNEEVAALYRAYSDGAPSTLAELPIQYLDFARWQRRWLSGERLEAHLLYWRRQLDGAPASLKLPTDRPRPAVQTFRGGKRALTLTVALTKALKALSRREGVSLFMTLLAAFETLLHRYSWQEDIVVGTPIANRNRSEVEGLIGFFVNTLVLRTRLASDLSFRELLARVREVTLGAYAYQDMPFEKLVDALHAGRDPSRHPLFQVFFALNNNPVQHVELPHLRLGPFPTGHGISKFDLEWSMIEGQGGLLTNAIYKADLFDDSTIVRMLERYEALLEEIAIHPERRLSDIPLLGEEPRQPAEAFFDSQKTDKFLFEL